MVTSTISPEGVSQLLGETLLSLAEATAVLPAQRRGKQRHALTVSRWIEEGKWGIYLEAFAGLDGTWYTSREALARFFARLTGEALARKRGGRLPPPESPAPAGHTKASAAAEAELRRLMAGGKKRA